MINEVTVPINVAIIAASVFSLKPLTNINEKIVNKKTLNPHINNRLILGLKICMSKANDIRSAFTPKLIIENKPCFFPTISKMTMKTQANNSKYLSRFTSTIFPLRLDSSSVCGRIQTNNSSPTSYCWSYTADEEYVLFKYIV